MKRAWLPLVATAALLAACHDDTTVPLSPTLVPGGPAFASAGTTSSDWEQCANDSRTTAPCTWIPSVLNVGKATYYEDESIPFRFAIHLQDVDSKGKVITFDPSKTRTVTFTYGFSKANHGNYDFLTQYDISEGARANLCSSDFSPVVPLYCAANNGPLKAAFDGTNHQSLTIPRGIFEQNAPSSPNDFAKALKIALDRYILKNGAGSLRVDLFGGAVTGFDPVTYAVGQETFATMTVKFKANQPDVIMAFGAHFSFGGDWKNITDKNGIAFSGGAGQSGSPFHIKVDQIDGTNNGALGNNVDGGVVLAQPGLRLTKTPSVSDVCSSANTSVTYTYVVTNTGNVSLTGSVTDDKLGAVGPFTLAAGASTTLTKSGIVTATTTNTATATASDGSNSVTATASALVTAHNCAIKVTKTPDALSVCNSNATVTYTYTVTNVGDVALTNVSLADDKLGTIASIGTMQPNDVQTFTKTTTLTATTTNKATASGTALTGAAAYTATDNASATVNVNDCKLSVTKNVDKTDVCDQAGGVTYTYTVTNAGNVALSDVKLVDDVLGTVGTAASLAAGATQTFTQAATLTKTTTNSVTATATGTAGTSVTASAGPVTVTVHKCSVSISKSPSVKDVCTSGSTPVTYTYIVTNTGDFFAASGSVTDDKLAAIGNFGPLAPGASATLTATTSLNSTTTNTATANATTGTASVSATATATVTAHNCSLSITKSPSVNDVCSGSSTPVTYTYVVKNTGDFFDASGSVTDDKIGGVGSFGPLAPGASATLTGAATISGTTTNTATATGISGGVSVTASASATVTSHNCSISVTKTPDKLSVCSGANASVTYTYVVKNTGDFFNASGSLSDDILGAVGIWGPLAPGATATLTKVGTVNSTTTNTATASGTSGGANVSATAQATVTANICGSGLIAPTQTTCEQFAQGTAPQESPMTAGLKGSTINNVAPGVIFYFATVTVGSTAQQLSVKQQNAPAKGPAFPLIQVTQTQANVLTYNSVTKTCSNVKAFPVDANQQPLPVSGLAPGSYIVQIKYTPNSLVGYTIDPSVKPASSAFSVLYSWDLQLDGGPLFSHGQLGLNNK